MRNIIFAFILSFSGAIQSLYSQQNKVDLRDVKQQVVELTASNELYANELGINFSYQEVYRYAAQQCFQMLGSDSAWTDLAYSSKLRNAWPAMIHLYRTLMMSKQYAQSKDVVYLQPIYRALAFWRKHDFKSANWWHNQINVPFVFSTILLNLGDRVQSADLNYYYDRIAPRIKRPDNTGQNKLWEQDNFARLALLKGDVASFAAALDTIKSLLLVTTQEGLQPDYSFQQHGAMLQFGNYGLHYINSLAFWMVATQHTPFAFSPAKQAILIAYLQKGLANSIYKGKMDVTAIGRQLRANGSTVRGQTVFWNMQLLKHLKEIDTTSLRLSGFGRVPNQVRTIDFWRSGYLLQRNPAHFSISVKTSGQGVSRVESFNGENNRGMYLSDGVTLFQTSGNEYEQILPWWNWKRLPGVTADTSIALQDTELIKSANRAVLVGQASNGLVGVSAMDYQRMMVKAHKSFFVFENGMLALGSNIQSANSLNLITGVNQQKGIGKQVLSGVFKAKKWVYYDRKLYYFVGKNQDVLANVVSRSGSWKEVDTIAANRESNEEVFDIYLKHNRFDSYAYFVMMDVDQKQIPVILAKLSKYSIDNSIDKQVLDLGTRVLITAYQPSHISVGSLQISVSQPCLLIYSKEEKAIFVSDPTRKLPRVELDVNGRKIRVDLPQATLAGSTIKVNLMK